MSQVHPAVDDRGSGAGTGATLAPIVDAIAAVGRCVTPGFLSPPEVSDLHCEAAALRAQGAFRPAGIGPRQRLAINPQVRSDLIHWLDPARSGAAIRGYLARLEDLRRTLNRELFLGLDDFEGYLALYPPRQPLPPPPGPVPRGGAPHPERHPCI